MADLSSDDLRQAEARDKRLKLLGISFDMQGELRNSVALQVFLAALQQDASDAMKDFANSNAADPALIIPLQVRVKTYLFLLETIETLMASASVAEQSIQQEDESLG